MKLWWCADCQAQVGLGKHGRCEKCESEAVNLLPGHEELKRFESASNIVSDLASASSQLEFGK
jgi:Zn finger protein HypA/HybF involved in hydrogenase expression